MRQNFLLEHFLNCMRASAYVQYDLGFGPNNPHYVGAFGNVLQFRCNFCAHLDRVRHFPLLKRKNP